MLTVETKKHIDAARQVLVGKVPDPKAQIDQITNALIYKFMDDMDVKAKDAGGKASFFTGELEQYAWRKLMDTRKGAQERLNMYTEALERFSTASGLPQLFRDIFRQAFLPYRDPETLNLFLKEIEFFDYSHSEELGNAFEYLLSIMGSQGDAGQFRTPRHIIDFMVDIIDPDYTDTILDPACGTAGFLISAYKHIVEKHDGVDVNGEKNNEAPLTHQQKQKLMDNLEGYDISSDMVKLARVNMYLHGNKSPKIFEYDTLTSEERWNDNFDVIIANPPFMSPKGGIRPHKKFGVESSRAEVLFVDYIMSHLKQNGRAGIIVPDGLITRPGSSFVQLRRLLIDNGLFAVIDLPRGVFQPYSKTKTSILLIDKKYSVQNVLFARIQPIIEQRSVEIDQNTKLNESQVADILINYIKHHEPDDSLREVSKDVIRNSDQAVLHGEYYDVSSSDDGFVEIGDILERVSQKVGDRKDVHIMSITMKDGLIDQAEKFNKRIANTNIANYKLVERNELVVGFPIDEGVLGFQTKYNYAAVSPAYDVWRLKRDIPVTYLQRILRSPQAISIYKKKMKGTANRRRVVPKDVFLKIKIPLPETVNDINDQIESLNILQEDLTKKIKENERKITDKIAEAWGAN